MADWRSADLLRVLRPPEGIDLSSNDYLNLSNDPRVVRAFVEGIRREGCGSTGSRLLRGERECFDSLERRFAAFKAVDRAILFGSGYLANVGVLTTLPEKGDLILSDERNHASLIDGMRLSRARTEVFRHNAVNEVQRLLAEAPSEGVRFVVVESLFSMEGDMAPLADYAALCESTGALLIVDEAHAVGVYGARGSGLIEAAGLDREICISINTGGKALGVSGAFAAGPAWAIDYLRQRARPFVFSTAPPPAIAPALEASLDVVAAEPERRTQLRSRSTYLRKRLIDAGFAVADGTSQIVPVLLGENARVLAVSSALRRQGFDVRPIRPPSVPAGSARLRVSVNTSLSESTLDSFVEALGVATREVSLC